MLRSGRYAGKGLDANADTGLASQLDAEPANVPGELEPLLTDEVVTEDLHEPGKCLDGPGNEMPDHSTDLDDFSEVDMDPPLRVTFGKEL